MPIRQFHHATDTRPQLPTGRARPSHAAQPKTLAIIAKTVTHTELPCHAGTPQDLVNPWTLAFGPAGDSLYVATDPNHRTVHRFDAAGKLVRAERCADEAPNYLLCV